LKTETIKDYNARDTILSSVSKKQKKKILKFEKENSCVCCGCMESDEEFAFQKENGEVLFLFSEKLKKELRKINGGQS
jgi:hypothetical protein